MISPSSAIAIDPNAEIISGKCNGVVIEVKIKYLIAMIL